VGEGATRQTLFNMVGKDRYHETSCGKWIVLIKKYLRGTRTKNKERILRSPRYSWGTIKRNIKAMNHKVPSERGNKKKKLSGKLGTAKAFEK